MDKERYLIKNIQDKVKVDESFKELVLLYRPVILSIISSQIEIGSDFKIDRSDLYQEGIIALHKAAENYDFDNGKGAKFITFAYVVIKRQIYNFIRKNNRVYVNERRSIDNMVESEVNKFVGTSKIFESPEKYARYQEYCDVAEKFYKDLSPEQKQIFDMRGCGQSYEAIANQIGCNKKRVDNQIQKIRKDFEAVCGFQIKKRKSSHKNVR